MNSRMWLFVFFLTNLFSGFIWSNLFSAMEEDAKDIENGERGDSEDRSTLCNEITPNFSYPVIRFSAIFWFVAISCLLAIGGTYAMSISFGRFSGALCTTLTNFS